MKHQTHSHNSKHIGSSSVPFIVKASENQNMMRCLAVWYKLREIWVSRFLCNIGVNLQF